MCARSQRARLRSRRCKRGFALAVGSRYEFVTDPSAWSGRVARTEDCQLDFSNLLLWAVVILGSAYAGYLIGRWSVINDGTLDEYDETTGAAYNEYAGEEFRDETAPIAKGPASPKREDWTPKKPRTRTAKPPPALAGVIDGGAGGQRRQPSSSAKPPPAAAGLKS